ncbi:uncharacterized protein [Lolium perenne]|uniref:uncharacterized protein n=1 Tax=Lolium perenne TaxID=4522 RepID=UPI003A9913E3
MAWQNRHREVCWRPHTDRVCLPVWQLIVCFNFESVPDRNHITWCAHTAMVMVSTRSSFGSLPNEQSGKGFRPETREF